MKRTIRVEVSLCRRCGTEMCEPHLAAELSVAPRCHQQNLGHLCAECGQKHIDESVSRVANRALRAGVVAGVVIDAGNLKQVLVRSGRRRLTVHAERGGALVVSEDRTWR